MIKFFRNTVLAYSFLFSITFAQTTYYVSTSGNNSNNGLTAQTAFATLQHAADIAAAGDSVLVLAGNYAGFDIRTNGTQILPIVFKVIENNVVIDERNSVTPDGINIEMLHGLLSMDLKLKISPVPESVLLFQILLQSEIIIVTTIIAGESSPDLQMI